MKHNNIIVYVVLSMIGCSMYAADKNDMRATIDVSSSVFNNGDMIPSEYTGEGEDVSPPIAWSKVPKTAKSIAIICEDPDAPNKTWIHWVIYNIPVEYEELSKGIPKTAEPRTTKLRDTIRQGKNDFKKIGYGGPLPPQGEQHRYFFKVYVLDVFLPLEPGATRDNLISAMKGHIVGYGEIMGLYKRKK